MARNCYNTIQQLAIIACQTPLTHTVSADSIVLSQGWGGQLSYLGKTKKPYPRSQKVIIPEEGDQN